jgi:hypothetical protein
MCAVVVRARQYLVLKGRGSWFVKSLGRLGVCYSSEARAIRGAIDRAEKTGMNGKPSMVALFIKHNEPKIIWTFGQDPYPPMTFDLEPPSVLSIPLGADNISAAAETNVEAKKLPVR